jgi:hypothetical protein
MSPSCHLGEVWHEEKGANLNKHQGFAHFQKLVSDFLAQRAQTTSLKGARSGWVGCHEGCPSPWRTCLTSTSALRVRRAATHPFDIVSVLLRKCCAWVCSHSFSLRSVVQPPHHEHCITAHNHTIPHTNASAAAAAPPAAQFASALSFAAVSEAVLPSSVLLALQTCHSSSVYLCGCELVGSKFTCPLPPNHSAHLYAAHSHSSPR